MIKLERTNPPKVLSNADFNKERKKIALFYKEIDTQRRYSFSFPFRGEIGKELLKISHNKCSFCENFILEGMDADVDCFRPKSVYWWLAYEWDNLVPICAECQRYKADEFPVKNVLDMDELRRRKISQLNLLEQPLLIDPFLENPLEHFVYDVTPRDGYVVMRGVTEKGKISIETFGLNREHLLTERYRVYMAAKSLFDANKLAIDAKNLFEDKSQQLKTELENYLLQSWSNILTMANRRGRFAGMIFYLFAELLKRLTEYHSAVLERPIKEPKDKISISKFLPTKIELSNFKSLENIELELRSVKENTTELLNTDAASEDSYKESWLLLLGENGVGKSSILQAIVLALLPDDARAQYLNEDPDILRNGKKNGYVKIHLDNGELVHLTFDKKGNVKNNVAEFNDYLLAYGSTRLLPKGDIKPEESNNRIKVGNLFNYSIALENAISWLLGLNDDDFDQAGLYLKDLLFLKNNISRTGKDVFTEEKKGFKVKLSSLSDGYRTLLALAVDMLKVFATQMKDNRYRDIRNYARGVVLIDEIGTHLHPKWKMRIVTRLREALPKVFFIVTTHDPLCLRGLRDREVAVLVKDADTDRISILENLPAPNGLRIDQILTSKFFGLSSTIDPESELLFEQYYKLLAIAENKRTEQDRTAIDTLQGKLNGLKQLGDNPREELFYYAIDEILAKHKSDDDFKIESLKPEVIKAVNNILDQVTIKQA
ncbi:AAA family ATPase [Chryseolinea lacunae]|uniref:AAA family ATPase n=1 Tax=Chryseolinea lacunae TaxID=2801331 RepID=A0ABS1KZF0_9BACT|nr:AAA family ATPase [Chryseolinea lacunae]MBL0744843.1 AAA family ATPase [Chryseolinea lacunae]